MRVLLLTPEYGGEGGGIITFYRALGPALAARGVELHVIQGSAFRADHHSGAANIEGVRVETLEYDRLRRWRERFASFSATPGLRTHLAAAWAMWEQAGFGAGYDIVEASDWGLLLIPPVLEAACAVVVQCHASLGQIAVHDPMAGQETEALLFRLLEGASLSSADVVQTYSHANAAFWRAETSRAVDVLPPALKLPHPEDAVAPSDRCRVLGRLQRWKGPQVVCGALASLGSRAPIVEWYGRDMPWDGRGTSTAEHLAEEFPSVWGRSLSHKSPVAPTEVARLQASAFVNIVPSTWDVFNFTVVESMASGRPTVVSSGAGASELIKDGETGYIFESGSSSSLAAALERVLVAPSEILRGVGDAARASVDKLLSPESVATARLAAYESARGKFASDGCRHVPAWLDAVCRPGQVSQDEFAYLSQVPLREIATHLALRARDKIRPRTPPRRRIARA